MPFRVLIAASPCFTNTELFEQTLDKKLAQRPGSELHYLTQKGFTQLANKYCNQHHYIPNVHARDFFLFGKEATKQGYLKILDLMPDAAIVFWDKQTYNECFLIHQLQDNDIKHIVIEFEPEKEIIKRLKEEERAEKKVSRKAVSITKESKERYIQAHEKWHKKRFGSNHDFLYTVEKPSPISSGKAMDNFAVKFLNWSGHNATIIRATGRYIKDKWIPGTTAKGSADVTCTINGRSVKLESKFGNDKPGEYQLKQQIKERASKGVYEFYYSIEEFFVIYDKIISGEI